MAHTIQGKLAFDARESKSNEHTLFNFRIGVKYYDYNERVNKWTNYQITIFAKGGQVDFYRDVLKRGNLAVVSCEKLKACFGLTEDQKQYSYIECLNAKLDGAYQLAEFEPPADQMAPPPPPQQ